ncbi:MAG: hypothetical protein KatS3mg002_0335 [Candidatus Woesearchaeota archaeon]|nr:MAG: hypothetical protein KatS3mg002_0335 [Candidatus Woesearchaeota archaeon]
MKKKPKPIKPIKEATKEMLSAFNRINSIIAEQNISNEKSEKTILEKINKIISEQDVKIEVEHPGLLEVPEGKKVNELPLVHFKKLIKKKGWAKISKALINLKVWNKNDNPELSKWADKTQEELAKWVEKKREEGEEL